MVCPGCNTRIEEEGKRTCPHCGRVLKSMMASTAEHPKPRLSRLGPSSVPSEEAELELDEPAELELDEPAKPDETGIGVQKGPDGPAREGIGAPPPSFAPDPAHLRKMLAEDPTLLEAGLRVYSDERGKPVGAGFSTAVGEIDLLARDAEGGFVVVMVSDGDGEAELVARMLQRIGWVRKHLGEGQQAVRAIVLLEDPPDSLRYAAAAVADSVAIMTYRMALTFESVEL